MRCQQFYNIRNDSILLVKTIKNDEFGFSGISLIVVSDEETQNTLIENLDNKPFLGGTSKAVKIRHEDIAFEFCNFLSRYFDVSDYNFKKNVNSELKEMRRYMDFNIPFMAFRGGDDDHHHHHQQFKEESFRSENGQHLRESRPFEPGPSDFQRRKRIGGDDIYAVRDDFDFDPRAVEDHRIQHQHQQRQYQSGPVDYKYFKPDPPEFRGDASPSFNLRGRGWRGNRGFYMPRQNHQY